MKYTIKFSPCSLHDLEKVFSEILNISMNNNTAVNYINGIIDKIKEKEDFPESGTPFYIDNVFTGYRYVIFKSYIVFYKVRSEEILVDRILYLKSDYITLLSNKK